MKILDQSFFIKSRSKLEKLLLPESLVLISSNRLMPRNADQYFPFRQSSDLYYLSGIKQPNCTLVIFPGSGAERFSEVLYIPERDEKTSRWEGALLDAGEAAAISGIQEVRSLNYLRQDLQSFISVSEKVYFGSSAGREDSAFPGNEWEFRKDPSLAFKALEEHQLAPLMTRIRSYKEPVEIEMMREAISISNAGFQKVLQELRPGMQEYQLAAILSHEFHSRGAREHAFDPIIASGKNALTLHYTENSSTCNNGDLLLMDFGADWQYYAADISRTIPVNGRFSARQRALYEANLRVLVKAMALLKPGMLLRDINLAVGSFWEEEHVNLGLYSVNDLKKQDRKNPLWEKYYWHGTSHSIGIDVHDCYDRSLALNEGMVFSCEPGIYIPEEGIGIRLENDMLITSGEALNLSAEIPIEADDIEDLMNREAAANLA